MSSEEGDSRLNLDRLFDRFGSKAFPLHGSFLLGELALFAFMGIVATGIFLGLFYEPSTASVTVNGNTVPAAYASVLQINSFSIGLLVRRIHHWSAHIMLAAIVMHMTRVYFTGAYRKPRDINWVLGTGLLGLTILAAFLGYLLPFDEFAVTATNIGYQIATSVPFIGQDVANLLFAGPFPNSFTVPRFFTLHVVVIPAILASMIGLHLLIIMKVKHTQDPGITGRLKSQANTVKEGLVGVPLWPEQVVIMAGVFFTYATAVALLAAFVPVHPIEVFGPSGPGTPHVKPDWYLLWIYGILRVMPPIDIGFLGTAITSRFLAGAVVPGVIGGMLASVPIVDTVVTDDPVENPDATRIQHPFDRPGRTAIGVGAILFFLTAGVAGYYTEIGLGTNVMRALIIGVPLLGGGIVYGALKRRNRS